MSGTSLLALIDDIAAILDDVALMTKVAAKKTAGVLGDDLALNAEQVAGVNPDRELPVVWAVAKGSAINKVILVPVALGISAVLPQAVIFLLMIGGAYLCFEGVEKLAHKFLHKHDKDDVEAHSVRLEALANPAVDLVALEKEKIKGAIRTDFILSAELIVIALGTVATAPFSKRVLVLAAIGVLMTVGVYGIVAAIVKLDDAGLYLSRTKGESGGARFRRGLGSFILRGAPYLMKGLSVAGTIAMFLVGGGILTHGIPPVHHAFEAAEAAARKVSGLGPVLGTLTAPALDFVFGIVAGAVVLGIVTAGKSVLKKARA